MVNDTRRAQMILIGALLLATVVFGVSLLLNSLLYTSAAGAGGADLAVSQADDVPEEVERGVRSLIVRVNHGSRNVTAGGISTAVASNVTRFSRLYGESKAASGPVAVKITYDNDSSVLGYRIVQSADGTFLDANSDNSWTVVPGPQLTSLPGTSSPPLTPRTSVRWFTMNVDLENTSGSVSRPFKLWITNDTESVRYELGKTDGKLQVSAVPSWTGDVAPTCNATAGRILLDFYEGEDYGGTCTFPGSTELAGPNGVWYKFGHQIEGRYSVVVNRSNGQVGDEYEQCLDQSGDSPPPDEPCIAPVVWSANLTTRLRTDRLSFRNSYNMSLYPGER